MSTQPRLLHTGGQRDEDAYARSVLGAGSALAAAFAAGVIRCAGPKAADVRRVLEKRGDEKEPPAA
jgi:hypothetical protein